VPNKKETRFKGYQENQGGETFPVKRFGVSEGISVSKHKKRRRIWKIIRRNEKIGSYLPDGVKRECIFLSKISSGSKREKEKRDLSKWGKGGMDFF